MLTVFNILPLILLFLYSCSFFQNCLNCCHLNSTTLYTFMDTFQGCYHHRPKERRYFSALYLLIRIIEVLLLLFFKDILSYLIVSVIYLIFAALAVIFLKPYKKEIENSRDAAFFLWYALGYLIMISYISEPQLHRVITSLSFCIFFIVPLTYLFIAAARTVIPKKAIRLAIAKIFQPRIINTTLEIDETERERLLPLVGPHKQMYMQT